MKKLLFTLFALLSLTSMQAENIYDFTVLNGDSAEVSLKQYEGKVLLIVNTASKCGFTPQFDDLEKLYRQYKEQGLVILGFPCNQFGAQDPGTNAEIQEFCRLNYGVSFPMMWKIDVNGAQAAPLFTFLKSQQAFGGFDQNDQRGKFMHEMMLKRDKDYAQNPDIKWNFTKFLIDRQGRVLKRFEPTDKMEDVESAIKALGK